MNAAACWTPTSSRRPPTGYHDLLVWLGWFGPIDKVGVEGTGTYGAGLARHLLDHDVEVIEVDRPNRQRRRRAGKSDTTDAVSAARAALSGEASTTAKTRDGNVEKLRVLRVARRSIRHDRVRALNQLRAMIVTAPPELRDQLGVVELDLGRPRPSPSSASRTPPRDWAR